MARLFDIFEYKGLQLKNRIVMPPMCMFIAGSDGKATKWHEIHYGSRAIGRVGLIIQEATSVEKRGRLSDNDLGIWSDDHIEGLKDIVNTVHYVGGKIAIQLAHGGRKSWDGDKKIVAPSSIPFSKEYEVPQELTADEISSIVENFKKAALRSVKAGYDLVEIHGAHGYLIHQFLSPFSNMRKDEYGGSLDNRMRFPVEVIKAVKGVLPENMPLMMRISAIEYIENGYTFNEMIEMTKVFRDEGVEILDVSTGGASPDSPQVWPGYQIPYAQKLKQELGIPVIGCGLITTGNMAEEIISNERVDLVAVGRGILADSHWPLSAAKDLNVKNIIPKPYRRGYPSNIN